MLVAYAFSLFRPGEEGPRYGLDHEFAIDSDEFLPSIAGVTDMVFLPGNHIRILNNGDEFYPSMLGAIERAERSITIEAYIYWAGEIGKRFARALADRARRGVKVKILLDAVGSATISDEIVDTLKAGNSSFGKPHCGRLRLQVLDEHQLVAALIVDHFIHKIFGQQNSESTRP